jgi:hypothetical protein
MTTQPEMSDVFRFIELRAPFSPEAKALRQSYIRDDSVGVFRDKPCRVDADLQSTCSPSTIGRLVFEQVFCSLDAGNPAANLQNLIEAILGLLMPYQPPCNINGDSRDYSHLYAFNGALVAPEPLQIFELERHPHIHVGDIYYLLPERLEQIPDLTLFKELLHALGAMERARKSFTLSKLVRDLEVAFVGQTLAAVVFTGGVYTDSFRDTKRTLFDTLYLLYVLRRRTTVNLEYVIEGLRVLHVVEALALDSLIGAWQAGSISQSNKKMLEALFPELQGRNGSDPLTTLPLIQTPADFEAYFTATPVIHPIFARLHWYKRPFNDIRPIGVGDLKVVKQWLTGYLPGEISHIENVLTGEVKDRTHRRLEKTEETFSFSSDSKTSSQKDTQSTDRLELKREVESVVKSDTNVGVNTNANVTYTYPGGMVVVTASVGASFGYKRETSDQSKTSNMFSRETISKAVEQIEKNVSERRSVTKLFETEETNKHAFVNDKPGAKHVTGIYRWLDKKYKAQLFNYGKRMMFEFVIPEPAAFLVESRIRAFESTLECPQPPPGPFLKPLSLKVSTGEVLTPERITENEFLKLAQKYDLSEFVFPPRSKRVSFLDPATGNNYFEKTGTGSDNDTWSADTYHCKLKAAGYSLSALSIEGILGFQDTGTLFPDRGNDQAQNTLVISINGAEVFRDQKIGGSFKQYTGGFFGVPPPANFEDDVDLTIGLWDRQFFRLTIVASLTLSTAALREWQLKVLNRVQSIEKQRVDKENQEIQLAYDTQMSTYRNRLDQLKAQTINDLLQGQSAAFNREIILTELKKHCITMLTKEFDSNRFDDVITPNNPTIDPIQPRDLHVCFRKFKVKETPGSSTTASFEVDMPLVKYPSIDLEEAKRKGRFIQFLEQAFEWRQLAFMFYPYFWATPPKWIDMMNRRDDTDPNLTAFLQAGSVRVLLAVTPSYDEAVLHFLATREPWDGGPAPVIGDPLFIPLHEELRKQQDDLYNAVPEGTPWTFILPTSLVYLDGGGATLPTFPDLPT